MGVVQIGVDELAGCFVRVRIIRDTVEDRGQAQGFVALRGRAPLDDLREETSRGAFAHRISLAST